MLRILARRWEGIIVSRYDVYDMIWYDMMYCNVRNLNDCFADVYFLIPTKMNLTGGRPYHRDSEEFSSSVSG